MTVRRTFPFLLLMAPAVILIALQLAGPEPSERSLWSNVLDGGHAPLYGLLALAILRLLQSRGAGAGPSGIRPYLLALALAILAGAGTELIQFVSGRDADSRDLAHDAMGAAAFLLVAAAFDSHVTLTRFRPPRWILLLAAALLIGAALTPLAESAAIRLLRDRAFPAVCDFQADWEMKFVVPKEADVERTRPPEEWGRRPGERVAQVRFRPGTISGVSIQRLYPDWSRYRELVFDVYSQLAEPVRLTFSIHDIGHDRDSWDYFNREFTVEPGANRIVIPLRDIQIAPRDRELDLSRMCGLVVSADHPAQPFVLYLDAFHLE